MPALALSRVGARVVESVPDGGQELAAGAWQRLEALADLPAGLPDRGLRVHRGRERPAYRGPAVDQAG